MASEWKETTLGEVITLQRGHDLPSQKRVMGEVPIVSSSGVTDYHNLAAARGPGVITGRYGTIGEVFYMVSDYWPLNTTLYVKDFKGNDPKFVYYLLKTVDFHQFNDKSSVPGVNRNHAHLARVSVPAPETQRRIASILSAFDDKIELNRRMNRTLEAMARALFKSWFVDFEPVRAKMRGEAPLGMDAETAALFPEALLEVDGREVPMGWEVKRVKDVLELAYGKALKADIRLSGTIPVYGSNGSVGFHDKALVEGPGIVVGRKGNPGFVKWSSQDFFPIDTTFYVVGKSKTFSMEHAFYTLENLNLPNLSADSAVPGLNRDAAYSQNYLMPSPSVLAFFDHQAQILRGTSINLETESAHLEQLRDALLPRLLSGELDVTAHDLDAVLS